MTEPTTSGPVRTALVTGATGYIGGLLVQKLLDAGWTVRVLTRHRDSVASKDWSSAVDVSEGDAGSADDLRRALDGVDVAYYLIHSMGCLLYTSDAADE